MAFKVGDRVVCVYPVDNLVKNEVYTISFLEKNFCILVELEFEPEFECYYLYRFRKLDYDFVEEVLKQIKQQPVEQV